ncbi:MAG TPA: alanine racemase C-terminal domain-containing protein, partial [Candidatus Paceibacterota bacterium]
HPAITWKAIISEVKWIEKGEGVGYDFTEKTGRKTKLAVIPVGYWHGYPRALSVIGRVSIHNKLAKVLGRVSMDMITVDVTNIKNVMVGDEAILVGGQVKADEVAKWAQTTHYEIITRLNPLIKRIYV